MKRFLYAAITVLLSGTSSFAQNKPYGLMTDLIERTDVVYLCGYKSSMSLEETTQALLPVQYAEIASKRPHFSWIVDGGRQSDVMQTAYEITVCKLVAVQQRNNFPTYRKQAVWNSGKVASGQSSSVEYAGPALEPNTVYHWAVKVWDNQGNESEWSEEKAFKTAGMLKDYPVAIEPIVKTDQFPETVSVAPDGSLFVDFGKAAFGQLRLTLTAMEDGEKIVLHLGERIKDGRVDRQPFGSCRYRRIELALRQGTHTYQPKILPDYRNTHGDAVLMPDYIGEVMPFRYLEIEGCKGKIDPNGIVRMFVHHPFNDFAADFRCSDDIINQVWDLCKYSMKATSFTGYHIDGDRERIPYECDALVNQLGCYGTDRVYSLSRRSLQHLLDHPTWPTEWILQTVLMAWHDYMYTGDTRVLASQYDLLGRHTLLQLRDANGLISTRTKEQDDDFLRSINRKESIRDIVDWPQGKGSFGLPDSNPGEADYFDFRDYNTVINAYHYKTLLCMKDIASALGKTEEASRWENEAAACRKVFNKLLFNSRQGRYIDGAGSEHSAIHSNLFPLAFGMVPEKQVSKVAEFVQSRGMACSIANANFLVEGLFDAGFEEYALSLLNATHDRSWYNTIKAGSTITFEAWDDKYKGNQDWNHAWGGAPASLLPHKLLGVEPRSPAWNSVLIHPRTASLKHAEGIVPTIKGPVAIKIDNDGKSYVVDLDTPANMIARVLIPVGPKGTLTLNGEPIKAAKDASGKFFVLDGIGSGHKVFKAE